jgi:hypothetical protein
MNLCRVDKNMIRALLEMPLSRRSVAEKSTDDSFFLHLTTNEIHKESKRVGLGLYDEIIPCKNFIRRYADKSLARPGRKEAKGTKIYSTYSPWSSIHFLARFSNFCKPLKKIQVVRPTRPPRQQWPPCRTKRGELSNVFFSPGNRR